MLFQSLGLVASADVTSCSASDFVTGFANQAGIKTRELFDKAVGGVLFIDEAYRLVGTGAKESEGVLLGWEGGKELSLSHTQPHH